MLSVFISLARSGIQKYISGNCHTIFMTYYFKQVDTPAHFTRYAASLKRLIVFTSVSEWTFLIRRGLEKLLKTLYKN